MKKTMALLTALAMSAAFVPQSAVLAAPADSTVVTAEEKWNYDYSDKADDYFIHYTNEDEIVDINGGFGWNGGWKADPAAQNDMTAGSGHGYVRFNSEHVASNPSRGFQSNGANIYRKLNVPVSLGEENEFYLTWSHFTQGNPTDGEFSGISLLGDSVIMGATPYNEEDSVLAVKTPEGIVKGETLIKATTANISFTYVAKIKIDPNGKDTIYLNAYRYDEAKEEYPTEWEITTECDLDNSGAIDVLGYIARCGQSRNVYFTGVKLYKKQSQMTKSDTIGYIKSNLNAIPAPDVITVDDLDECTQYVANINEALGWYDLDLADYDTEGKIDGYNSIIADGAKISNIVNIRNDMTGRIYTDNETMQHNNPLFTQSPNQGWDTGKIKDIEGWVKPWSETDGIFNVFKLDGVEYEMKVQATDNNSKDGQALNLAENPESLYFEYDLANGYYSSVNLLGEAMNSFFWNASTDPGRGKIGVILVYEDGSEEAKVHTFYDGSTDASGYGLAQIASGLYSYNTSSDMQRRGYAHEYEFAVDNTKKLDKIRVLKSYTALKEDNSGIDYDNGFGGMVWNYYIDSTEEYTYTNDEGEEITTTLGEYLCDLYALPNNRNSKTYGHARFGNILAITAVNTAADSKKGILELIETWPENPNTEQASALVSEFESVEAAVNSIKALGSDVSAIENNAKYMAVKKAVNLLSEVPVIVDISEKFNKMGYAYEDTEAYPNQNPYMRESPNTGMEIGAVKALPGWKYDWNKISDDFNVYKLDGQEFRMKIRWAKNDDQNWAAAGYSTAKDAPNGGVVDIDNGHYTSISILANGANNYFSGYQNPKAGIYVYYTDSETPELMWQEVYSATESKASAGYAEIAAPEIGKDGAGNWIGYTGNNLYMHKYDFKLDYSRELDKIEFVGAQNKLNDDGTGLIPTEKDTERFFGVGIYALSLGRYMSDYLEEVKTLVEPKIAALPETITADDKDAVLEIKEIIDEAVGYGADPADIEGYEKYAQISYDFAELDSVTTQRDFDNVTLNVKLLSPTKAENITKDTVKLYKDGELSDEAYDIVIDNVQNGLSDSFKVVVDNTVSKSDYSVKINVGYLININKRFSKGSPLTVTSQAIGSDDSILTSLESMAEDMITIDVNLKSEVNTDYTAVTALYDGDDRLRGILDIHEGTVKNGEDKYTTDYIELPAEVDERWGYKVIVADSMENMKPLAESFESFSYGVTYGYDNVIDTSKDLNVVYFGDSQTEGEKYTTAFTGLLEENRTGKVNAYVSGLGGTASMQNVWRVQKDVLAYEPDLVFVEFAPNDCNYLVNTNYQPEEVKAATEGIIRKLLEAKHKPVIMLLIPMSKENLVQEEALPIYEEICEAYGNIGIINFDEYADMMAASNPAYAHGNLTQSDGIHFNDEGGRLCAEYMYTFMDNADYVKKAAYSSNVISNHEYVNPDYCSALLASYDDKWADVAVDISLEGYGTPTSSYAHYMQTAKKGAEMTFTFTGTTFGFYNLIGKDGSTFSYVIDDTIAGTGSSIASTDYFYKSANILVKDLQPGEHTITITNTGDDGKQLGFAYFITDENN